MKRTTDTREKWMSFNEDLGTYDELFLFHRKMYRVLINKLRFMIRRYNTLRERYVMCCQTTYRWTGIAEGMIKQMQELSTKLNRERMSTSLLLDKLETMGMNTEELIKIIRETTEKAVIPTTREDVLVKRF